MAAGGSFDQWQKDVFFTAAEEVQESADTMESFYRMWMRNCRDGFDLEASDELLRELQTALGTAKWQLEEFEKAVELSHGSFSSEGNAITRHRQFVSAIGNQILRVEKGLNDSLIEEGKQPLRWVQLNEEEREDLADFLSGVPRDRHRANHVDGSSSPGSAMLNKDKQYVIEAEAEEPYERENYATASELEQSCGQKGLLGSPGIGACKVAVDDDDIEKGSVEARSERLRYKSGQHVALRNVVSTSKWKQLMNNIWKAKNDDDGHLHRMHRLSHYLDLKGITQFTQAINGNRNCSSNSNQETKLTHSQYLAGNVGTLRRHIGGSRQQMHFIRYLWITFLFLLSVVLVGKFDITFLLFSDC
ncbi:syntaxin-61-like isoform X1 [Curcuma longa]|uniref:syntaxin-61-like isoform X1 n=1 Tax=Curcuma longa TaxID=136217 RepID=UPI003D9E0048